MDHSEQPFLGMHRYHLEPDGQLVLTYANTTAEKVLHLDHSQLLGTSIDHIFPGLANGEIPEKCRRVAQSGQPWKSEAIEIQFEANDLYAHLAVEDYAAELALLEASKMPWQITRARSWEGERHSGHYSSSPPYKEGAPTCEGDNERLEELLADGWEPIVAAPSSLWDAVDIILLKETAAE